MYLNENNKAQLIDSYHYNAFCSFIGFKTTLTAEKIKEENREKIEENNNNKIKKIKNKNNLCVCLFFCTNCCEVE